MFSRIGLRHLVSVKKSAKFKSGLFPKMKGCVHFTAKCSEIASKTVNLFAFWSVHFLLHIIVLPTRNGLLFSVLHCVGIEAKYSAKHDDKLDEMCKEKKAHKQDKKNLSIFSEGGKKMIWFLGTHLNHIWPNAAFFSHSLSLLGIWGRIERESLNIETGVLRKFYTSPTSGLGYFMGPRRLTYWEKPWFEFCTLFEWH